MTNHDLQATLLRWYDRRRRDLPWRTRTPDPYRVLVSEFMLQQTQVATVVPYFHRFMQQFATLADLAAASEQEVLRLWQGLGYYTRARNLHATAKTIAAEHRGQIPRDLPALMELPGIGRYTAGAIASIAFDRPAPILDGNVTRVLCRLDKITRPDSQLLWSRAAELVPLERAGDFNSALMELGATVCSPRNPQCGDCPLRSICKAKMAGLQETIPHPKKSPQSPLEKRWTFVVHNRNRWLIEQRPAQGRWASLWQFVTVVQANGKATEAAAAAAVGFAVLGLTPLGRVAHLLSHRRYQFSAFLCAATKAPPRARGSRKWVTLKQLDRYPISNPQLKIAQMLRERLT